MQSIYRSLFRTNQQSWLGVLCCFVIPLLFCTAGCSDGPFYELKKLNPYYRKQWNADRKLGPTFDDRLSEMRALAGQLKSMPEPEQAQWLASIEQVVKNDPSPEMRRFAILALKDIKQPEALPALKAAASDKSEKVQMAACEVFATRVDGESLTILSELSQKQKSTSVRVAAIQAMGSFPAEEIKPIMSSLIADRSPAVQYECTAALSKATQLNLGGDVADWKRYLAGEEVTPAVKTVSARISELNPLAR
jgi:HEAT repeats